MLSSYLTSTTTSNKHTSVCLFMFSNNQQMDQLLSDYFTLLLLHVSATVCHPRGARLCLLSYMPIWVFG
jgi:hypothetical protein